MEKILLNIGNTHSHFATINCEVFLRAETKDVLSAAEHADFKEAYCACVVPKIAAELEDRFGNRMHFLSASDINIIDFSNVDVSTTGADRLANLLGAQKKFPMESVLVLDCGTCVTGELLVEGAFKGGFIHPGRQLQRQSLEDHTGALPRVMLTNFPPQLTGTDTSASIMSGIDNVSYLGIQSMVKKLQEEYSDLKIILTGGDAGFYENIIPDITDVHDLTLQGLAVFASFA